MDVIDTLAGIPPGSALGQLRTHRPDARAHSQATYDALFEPTDDTQMSRPERHAVAAFVAALHQDAPAIAHYAAGQAAVQAEAARALAPPFTQGPYGAYPPGPHTPEDVPGPTYAAIDPALPRRLAAALAHAHMLVFHPRDATPAHLQALLDAGWSETGIVTLSQLVAFLSYQIRAAAGLRLMTPGAPR